MTKLVRSQYYQKNAHFWLLSAYKIITLEQIIINKDVSRSSKKIK